MSTARHQLVPKLFSVLQEGYSLGALRADLLAGLTVAIVALPLAMALAIASGAAPHQGLITAIVAGGLISLLGGSRHQIGGPTAAFIVVVLNVILEHGYDGMLLATFMAGLMLMIAGALRLGTYIKYVPHPVITGFTAGIALSILISQLGELFGIRLSEPPRDSLERLSAYAAQWQTASLPTLGIGLGALLLMLAIRRWRPKWPVFLIGTAVSALALWLLHQLHMPVEVATIGSRFPALETSLPAPALPAFSWEKVQEVFPSAITITFLAGIEALLSAVVADGMTGRRHRSNMELVAQGVANCASPLFGGLPATGAIARTATNIRAGAHGPLAGVFHALFVLAFLLAGMPLAQYVPLAALAAILIIVAWNISEIDKFRHLMQAPLGDRVVLVTTFLLTVFVDLTVAIKVGVIMAALLFMHRMATLVEVQTHESCPLAADTNETENLESPLPARSALPERVEVFRVSGPFFFGAASQVAEALEHDRQPPRLLILDLSHVPMMDASGVAALQSVQQRIARGHGRLVLAGLQAQPQAILRLMKVLGQPDSPDLAADVTSALRAA